MTPKQTTETFIKRAKEIHSDTYGYDKSEYKDARTNIEIFCFTCNEYFWQTPDNHINKKKGCNKCKYKRVSDTLKGDINFFITKAEAKHGKYYDYSQVEYNGSKIKVKIGCPVCKEFFLQRAESHWKFGCKKCSMRKLVDAKRSNTIEFIKKGIEKYKDLYGYDKVNYKKNSENVEIWCVYCEKYFNITPNHFLGERGCQDCGIRKRDEKQRDTLEIFKEKSIKVHDKLYDYGQVVYKNYYTKVTIKCNKCNGNFEQIPNNHITWKHGCPKCAIIKRADSQRSNKEEFIEKSVGKHGNKYDYDNVVYVNCKTKVEIKCNKCENNFFQTPNDHLAGNGCQFCKNKTENMLYVWLLKKFNVVRQYSPDWLINKKYRFDFFFNANNKNIILELDGSQHYSQVSNWDDPENIRLRDVEKMFCGYKNNHVVIRILQEDVFYNRFDWGSKILQVIDMLNDNDHFVYITDSNVYDKHKEDLQKLIEENKN